MIRLTKIGVVFVIGLVIFLLVFAFRHFQRVEQQPSEKPFISTPIDDAFWFSLDRRRSDKFRAQLKAAPPVLVVRESHFIFNATNSMGIQYGWLDERLANFHITFSSLVGVAYGKDYAHTEFPEKWTNGHWTNFYDVIVTVTNQPKAALAAAARQFLQQEYGLSWHLATNNTEVLLIRANNPRLLESKATTDFSKSKAIAEFVSELENYFSLPVIDETGATNRYDKALENVPARWINGRTTDLDANNQFLHQYGLELVSAKRAQEWLVMEQAK